jgi:hypothetical protein
LKVEKLNLRKSRIKIETKDSNDKDLWMMILKMTIYTLTEEVQQEQCGAQKIAFYTKSLCYSSVIIMINLWSISLAEVELKLEIFTKITPKRWALKI